MWYPESLYYNPNDPFQCEFHDNAFQYETLRISRLPTRLDVRSCVNRTSGFGQGLMVYVAIYPTNVDTDVSLSLSLTDLCSGALHFAVHERLRCNSLLRGLCC